MVAERLSPAAWDKECQRVRNYVSELPRNPVNRQLGAERLAFIDQALPVTSHPFVILFCYADIPAGTSWGLAFDPKTPLPPEETHAVFQFGLFGRTLAVSNLEHGHHQLAVIDFPHGLPPLLQSLPVDANRQNYDHIALCCADDFREILSHRKIADQ